MNEHVCVHSEFSRLRPVYCSRGREGRVAFGLLRHGAPVLALPKTRVVNPSSRTLDPLFPSWQLSQFHPAAAFARSFKRALQSNPPRAVRSRGRGEEAFRVSLRRRFSQRLQSKPLRRFGQGAEFRFPVPPARRLPFWRQPYKLSAFDPGVNPCSVPLAARIPAAGTAKGSEL